jgi:hypothetical protein
VRHCGSMHGSVRVHMVYSVRAKLAVRITAPFAIWRLSEAAQTPVSARKPGGPGAADTPGGTKASSYPWDLLKVASVKTALAVMTERPSARTPPVAGQLPGTGSQPVGGHVPRMCLRHTFHALPVDLPDEQAGERQQVRYRVLDGGQGFPADTPSSSLTGPFAATDTRVLLSRAAPMYPQIKSPLLSSVLLVHLVPYGIVQCRDVPFCAGRRTAAVSARTGFCQGVPGLPSKHGANMGTGRSRPLRKMIAIVGGRTAPSGPEFWHGNPLLC